MNYEDYPEDRRNYMLERDKLIEPAEKFTNSRVHLSNFKNEEEWKAAWSNLFHKRMNYLWNRKLAKKLYRRHKEV